MNSQPSSKRTVEAGRVVWLEGSSVRMLDQRLLPEAEKILTLATFEETVEAIRDMAVRGAGSIGVAAGYAAAQAALAGELEQGAQKIRAARPTAKNLFYAVDRVVAAAKKEKEPAAAKRAAVREAEAIETDDVDLSRRIAEAGLPLLPKNKAVMTHCNAGWLAYAGLGTALAPLYLAHERGEKLFVIANETRPRSQGAKLTVWELSKAGIPHALIADTASGSVMRSGEVGLVIVGADRIAANGDTANKIGTYSIAVLAEAHKIPFYVAAPSPTFDAGCPSGDSIPIEQRDPSEVIEARGITQVRNPAFDVTPARLITGFITEAGIIQPAAGPIARFLEGAHRGQAPAAV